MNFLLSYPRSGNTWVRYIVEYLSKRPTIYRKENIQDNPIGSRINLGVDLDKEPILYKRHWLEPQDFKNQNVDKLILIIRDYKEAIPRHHKEAPGIDFPTLKERFIGEMRGLPNEKCDYIKAIQHFDTWPGPKLLLYYEDLISASELLVLEIAHLLELDQSRVTEFIKDINHHKQNSVQCYHTKSWTQGREEQLKFHQQQLPAELLNFAKQYIQTNFPNIYDKYLYKY